MTCSTEALIMTTATGFIGGVLGTMAAHCLRAYFKKRRRATTLEMSGTTSSQRPQAPLQRDRLPPKRPPPPTLPPQLMGCTFVKPNMDEWLEPDWSK